MRSGDTVEIKHTKILINGEWVKASDGAVNTLINPATEEMLTEVASGGKAEIEAAIASSRAALESGPWSKMDGGTRGRLLWKLADLCERDLMELARLETANQGKPIFESSKIEVPFVASLFRYYAGWADKLGGETIPGIPGFLNYTLREPVGVVGMIIPWNFPLLLTVWKLAPALAAGCTAVIKPSEATPLTALKLGALCLEAGIPAGVVNVVPGKGSVAGQALLDARGVDKIAFTGSTEVGRTVMKSAAGTIKRISLELGGKSPNVVFADAKLDAAANGACSGIFYNKGEVCAAGSRLFVEKKIHDEFRRDGAGQDGALHAGRSHGRQDALRAAGNEDTPRRNSCRRGSRRQRRRHNYHGRKGRRGERARILPRAHHPDRRSQRHGRRARRDLRTRPVRDSVRERGRGGEARERQRLRTRFRRVDAGRRPRAPRGGRASRGNRMGEHLQRVPPGVAVRGLPRERLRPRAR
jgi:hypothetical protein